MNKAIQTHTKNETPTPNRMLSFVRCPCQMIRFTILIPLIFFHSTVNEAEINVVSYFKAWFILVGSRCDFCLLFYILCLFSISSFNFLSTFSYRCVVLYALQTLQQISSFSVLFWSAADFLFRRFFLFIFILVGVVLFRTCPSHQYRLSVLQLVGSITKSTMPMPLSYMALSVCCMWSSVAFFSKMKRIVNTFERWSNV